MPGFARPIEFNIPTSVSAMRTGALPPRGSGVTVLVTKGSRERATSGAVSASRHPEALSSIQYRSLDAQTLELAADLDRTAVTRPVAACHRRFPREWCCRRPGPNGLEHRLRSAGEHVHAVRDQLRDQRGLDARLGIRDELRRPSVECRAEAEHRRRMRERLSKVRKRCDSDAAPDEEGALGGGAESLADREIGG